MTTKKMFWGINFRFILTNLEKICKGQEILGPEAKISFQFWISSLDVLFFHSKWGCWAQMLISQPHLREESDPLLPIFSRRCTSFQFSEMHSLPFFFNCSAFKTLWGRRYHSRKIAFVIMVIIFWRELLVQTVKHLKSPRHLALIFKNS